MFQMEDMTKEHPIYEQEEATLKSWVDQHRLKKIHDTWYKDGRRVVTNDLEHWRSLIQSHHYPPVYGHPGINQTIRKLERYYWWPGLQKEVTDYVKGCAECQHHKVNNHPTWAALSPIYPMLSQTLYLVAFNFLFQTSRDCEILHMMWTDSHD